MQPYQCCANHLLLLGQVPLQHSKPRLRGRHLSCREAIENHLLPLVCELQLNILSGPHSSFLNFHALKPSQYPAATLICFLILSISTERKRLKLRLGMQNANTMKPTTARKGVGIHHSHLPEKRG